MIHRPHDPDAPRPTLQDPARPRAGGRRRSARRPMVEALEGRALLSVAGGPDFAYSPGSAGGLRPGLASINFSSATNNNGQATTGQALQADGKDVIIGLVQNSLSGQTPALSTIYAGRLNADGSVDTTFGTGGSVNLPAAPGEDVPQAVALQADGKIVVLANISGTTTQVALYRLNADGSPDATFGTAGVVDFQFAPGGTASTTSTASTLAIQANGDIVVGGESGSGGGVAVARFTAAGAADSTFGTAGQAFSTFTSGNTAVPDGGVIGLAVQAGGQVDFETTLFVTLPTGLGSEIAVGQLTAAGAADATFGTGGQVILSGSTYDAAGGLAVQADGRVIAVGAYYHSDTSTSTATTHYDVYRLTTAGALDTTFATAGEATPVTQASSKTAALVQDKVDSVLVQPDGKILVGGEYNAASSFPYNLTVARLNADGSPDLAFGIGGRISLPIADGNPFYVPNNLPDTTYGLALQPGGKILVATDNGVARLLASGGTNDFNNDGVSDPAVLLPNFQSPFVVYRPSGAPAGTPDVVTPFGTGGAGQTLPAPGAYNASGIDELGVYLPALGAFGIRPYGTTGPEDELVYIGQKGLGNSIPASADYAGAGYNQFGVFEPGPADFVYSLTNSTFSADATVQFGAPGAGNSIPVPADYDGSGHDEIAVYLPATASFAYRPANGGPDVFAAFGSPGAGNTIPVPGDYDGSGHVELGVYLPAIGAFAYRPYGAAAGTPDVVEPFGMPGIGNSVPMPGDYDGSGHVELAVYMPSIDAFAYRPYGGGKDVVISFGEPGSGNTIPFTATGAESIAGGSGGGGGSAHASAVSAGWVDFVPDVAGQAKKGAAGQNRT